MESNFDKYLRKSDCLMDSCPYENESLGCVDCVNRMVEEHEAKIRAEVLREVEIAMYHQCFECNNDEDMQKWDSGNWTRYKLFENVIEQMKEQKDGDTESYRTPQD